MGRRLVRAMHAVKRGRIAEKVEEDGSSPGITASVEHL